MSATQTIERCVIFNRRNENLPALPRTASLLCEEALLRLDYAHEVLSKAHLMPDKFDSVEVHKALQSVSEAFSIITEMDIVLSGT